MTLWKTIHHFFAGMPDIGDDADSHLAIGHHKTMRIGSVVEFFEGRNLQVTDADAAAG